ncbi:hypothetical protein WAX88_19900 [Photobacterium damselae subsp. damselae]|uniref:hypothetical protein n=1 Tax=Photobacterium damselae TaxID=38293 RepID=UPI00311B08C9
MKQIKARLFTLLITFKPFFSLSYFIVQLLNLLLVFIGMWLLFDPTATTTDSALCQWVGVINFTLIYLLKHHYRQLLSWCDIRKQSAIVVPISFDK